MREPQIAKALPGDLAAVMRDEMKPNYLADGPDQPAHPRSLHGHGAGLGPEVFARQSRALPAAPTSRTTLAAFRGPALVLMGAEDRLCPRDRHDLMHALIAGSRLAIIDGPATCPRWNNPKRPTAELPAGWRNDGRTLLALLRKVDTPTVCNAIEVAQGRRGFAAFTRGTMLASDPGAPPVVGYAATAKIAGHAPSSEAPEVVRAGRMAYYRMMAEAPKPSVAVIEDLDFPDCVGAYWGEINTSVHKGFGMSGALTNGVMRDLGDLPGGFPVIAGSIGPSHGFVHVREVGTPVTVMGLTVSPGDLVHADRHGAVVVPPEVSRTSRRPSRRCRRPSASSLSQPGSPASTSPPSKPRGPHSKMPALDREALTPSAIEARLSGSGLPSRLTTAPRSRPSPASSTVPRGLSATFRRAGYRTLNPADLSIAEAGVALGAGRLSSRELVAGAYRPDRQREIRTSTPSST